MVGYLIICLVDTHDLSSNPKIQAEIISCINECDIIAHDFTFLFKNEDLDIDQHFEDSIIDFLNDPLGIIEEDLYDDLDEIEMTIQETQSEYQETHVFTYDEDYVPLYLQFVSSQKLFDILCEKGEESDIYNCEVFYFYPYVISLKDQMEILCKLQQPPTEADLMGQLSSAQGKKKQDLFGKIINKRKN